MNPATELCAGCYRTLDEIAEWSRLDDPARSVILQAVGERRQQRSEDKDKSS